MGGSTFCRSQASKKYALAIAGDLELTLKLAHALLECGGEDGGEGWRLRSRRTVLTVAAGSAIVLLGLEH